jgi:hypothetical protein
MSKLVLLFLITFTLIASGCVSGPGPQELDDAHAAVAGPDLCANVTCPDSTRECPDGETVSCTNTCSEGECTSCMPSCSGHESDDPCAGIVCPPTTETCADGSSKTCQNTCSNGDCTACDPGCPVEECNESWSCNSWSDCSGGTQTRVCTDGNDCGTIEDRPALSQSCTSEHIIFSEAYYDVDGDDAKGEWIELFNPGSNTNISGWTITDNTKTFTIPEAVFIRSDAYMILSRDNATIFNTTGCSSLQMTLGLNNDGDYLILKDSEGNEIDFVAWEKGGSESPYASWDITATSGETIRRKDIDAVDTDSVSDWEVSDPDPDC